MYLAIRDIRAACGRFGLIAGVVGLITLLVVMLSGLTGGLAKQNTSALEALAPEGVIVNGESFPTSRITTDELSRQPGGAPLGTTQTSMNDESVAVLGLPAGHKVPGGSIPDDGILVSQSLADDTSLRPGDTATLAGSRVRVSGVVPTEYFSHSPVVWANTDTWANVAHVGPGAVGNAILLSTQAPGSLSLSDSFKKLPAYQAEQSSLTLIQVFLYVISALVTVSFLTVWTIQRTRDLAILRALGASPSYLLRDAVGEAAIVLAVGTGMGALIGAALGALAQNRAPFQLDAATTVYPALAVFVLGLIGALVATRRVTTVDPNDALAAA